MRPVSLTLIGLALITTGVRAQTSPPQPAPLYVEVETDNPAALARLQRTNNQQEFANDTLRSAANQMASAAHWASPVIVLHSGEKPPANAAVLRLLLPEGAAEFIASSDKKPVFLGRVGALPVHSHYPDPYVYRHRVDTANLEDRPVIRQQIELEKDLYASLQTLEKHLGQNHLSVGSDAPSPANSVR